MRPRDVQREVSRALRTRKTIMVLGKPGIGKTELCAYIARELSNEKKKVGFKRIVLPQYEEVDLRGVPEVNDKKRTVFYPTEELPYADKDGEFGILLCDELPSAKPSVQVIMHQLLDSRRLGSIYELPPGWIMVITGNRAEDQAYVFEMPTTVQTRVVQITMEENFDDWMKWAYDTNSIEPEIISFLRANPQDFCNFTPEKTVKNHAIPRTWHYLSDYIRDVKEHGESMSGEYVTGQVGDGSGNKFFAWHKIWTEVPNIDDILEGKRVNVPKRTDIQWCVISAILSKLVAKEKEAGVVQYCRNSFGYLNELGSDIIMAFLNDIMNTKFWAGVKKKVVTSPEWVALAKKHSKTIVGDVDA